VGFISAREEPPRTAEVLEPSRQDVRPNQRRNRSQTLTLTRILGKSWSAPADDFRTFLRER